MENTNQNEQAAPPRIIKTARGKSRINEGVAAGFWPLVKRVEPSSEISTNICVYQHKESGEIKTVGDFRAGLKMDNNDKYERVIPWFSYYPYHFRSPIAAYLIPSDLKKGERVFLEDLIEDLVETRWNQGPAWRLKSCEAIWNGEDFEIQYNPKLDRRDIIG